MFTDLSSRTISALVLSAWKNEPASSRSIALQEPKPDLAVCDAIGKRQHQGIGFIWAFVDAFARVPTVNFDEPVQCAASDSRFVDDDGLCVVTVGAMLLQSR